MLLVAYLTVAILMWLRISVRCWVLVRSQYLVMILSQCCIANCHRTYPPIVGLLPSIYIKRTSFGNYDSKAAKIQVHATMDKKFQYFVSSTFQLMNIPMYGVFNSNVKKFWRTYWPMIFCNLWLGRQVYLHTYPRVWRPCSAQPEEDIWSSLYKYNSD